MPLYEIAMFVDARGSSCRTLIAMTEQSMRSVRPGEVVEVYATDPGANQEFHAWARRTGHQLLDWTSDRGTDRFVIRHK